MSLTFEEKQLRIQSLFNACKSQEEKYEKIIELGRQQKPLDPIYKNPENIVKGCQSTVYLHSFMQEGRVVFEGESDALISSGLAVLLIAVYSGEAPEIILTKAPDYLETLGIRASLTPNRANGLYAIHLRMKQDALRLLVNK